MPRKPKQNKDQLMDSPVLMLPAPRISHKGAHDVDPYASPAGAVPSQVSNERVTQSKPIDRQLSADEKQAQIILRGEVAAKADRYNRWLDALIANGGDKVLALAEVFEISPEEAKHRQYELEIEAREGMAATEVGEALERNDLGVTAQVHVLRRWVYSDNAAASINALKLVQEAQGDTKDVGSFESFLRLSKLQSGKA